MKTIILSLAMALCSQASIIPYLLAPPTPDGVLWEYRYRAILSGDQSFRTDFTSSDFWSLFDVDGYVSATWEAGALASADAIITSQFIGPGFTAPGLTDDAGIWNVVIGNDGPDIIGSGVDIDLGTLVLLSTLGTYVNGGFFTQAAKVADGSTTFNLGYVSVPGEELGVPEASTVLMLVIGLLALFAAQAVSRRDGTK